MMQRERKIQTVALAGAPKIPGLIFRQFSGAEDYEAMISIYDASNEADQIKESTTVEQMSHYFEHTKKVDPKKDVLIAETEREALAYCHVFWEDEYEGPRVYFSSGYVRPEWRRKGLGTAMLAHNEGRLRQIAEDHPAKLAKVLHTWAADTEFGSSALFRKAGYEPIRYFFLMLRPLDQAIPDAKLPEGLELSPSDSSQFRQIYEALNEAFRDHWGHVEGTEESYRRWASNPLRDPELWKVAWDGKEVAGMVLNEIKAEENKKLGVNWGWTDPIGVRRPWRRRGLAKALILESLKKLKSRGFSHAALGVDTENPSGALKLYEDLGFTVEERWTDFRKNMD